MSRNTDNEMARIQRGLEEFLEQEMASENSDRGRRNSSHNREPQLYDLEEDWDSRTQRKTSKRTDRAGSGVTQPDRARNSKAQSGKKQSGKVQSGKSCGNRQETKSGKTGSPGKNCGNRQETKSGKTGSPGKSCGNQPETKAGRKGKSGRQYAGNNKTTGNKKGAGNKKTAGKKFRRFLAAVVLIIALLGAGLYALVGAVYQKLNYVEVESVAGLPMKEDGVVNILLIGNDSRENGDDGRSDAMILLSVSSRTKTIYMTSLLRDMYVEIPGHDNNRLNAAYSFGGAELLMETVEKNFEIPVNRYVQVNFQAFVGLVDSVGGVDLELSKEEIEYVNGYLVEYNMLTERPQGTDNMDSQAAGLVHLNGPQALAYCRNRYLGTDFGRTERQRKVLTEVVKKIPGALLTNGSALFDALMPNLTTNLTKNECFSLSLMAGKALTYDIIADSIPQPGTYRDVTIRKMSVLEVDFETNRNYLKEKIYGGQD